jgi:Diacylglycerol kinase catalytic domain
MPRTTSTAPAAAVAGDAPSLALRLAALVALVAPIAMVVVAVVALAGDLWVAVLAAVAIVVISAAGWFALTARGAARAAGLTLAALALAALIALLATHWQGVVVLLVLLALVALFGLSARYALGRAGRAAVRHARAGSVYVGRAGTAALIVNLKSGGGKAERFGLAAEARRRGIEPIVLAPGDDLLKLAENAIDRGAEVVGMAGGDGSQALVATVAAGRGVAHVCIPAGTRNHFALDLGLDRDDVVGALDAFTDGVEQRIDLAAVNGRVFVNNASSQTPTATPSSRRGRGCSPTCSAPTPSRWSSSSRCRAARAATTRRWCWSRTTHTS